MPSSKFVSEELLYILSVILIGFFTTVYDIKLGAIYGVLALASGAIYLVLKSQGGPVLRLNSVPHNTLRQLFITFTFLLVFFVITAVVLGVFGQSTAPGQTFDIGLAIKKMTSYETYTPILASNVFITFLVFAPLVGFVETMFFFTRGFELILRMFNIPLQVSNPRTIAAMAIVGIIFMFFHLQVRGISAIGGDYGGLIITALFGFLSSFLVLLTREAESAVYAHVIWNGAVVLKSTGVL